MKLITIKFLLILLGINTINTISLLKAQTRYKTLPPVEFNAQLERTAGILIDVRTPAEFGEEKIERAVNIDVKADNFKSQISGLDKKLPYFIYCQSGKRSLLAMETMKKEGFTELYNLEGGIAGWKSAGLPTVNNIQIRVPN